MSKDKGFDGLDIENMFAEAVNASENTEGDNPGLYGKNPKKIETIKQIEKEEIRTHVESIETPITVESEPIIEIQPEEVSQPIESQLTEVVQKIKEPIIVEKPSPFKPQEKMDLTGINVNVINKIIEMKEIIDNYAEREQAFIKGYFQQEDGSSAEVIYSALTANPRSLDALSKIVIARGNNSAERAFYLMELSNNSVEAIYEQINLLTGELDNIDRVNDVNKIKVCRTLEKVISNMEETVFVYINKLQEFTSRALM